MASMTGASCAACAVRSSATTARSTAAHKHVAEAGRAHRRARVVPDVPAGSPFFCVDLLEHLDVEVTLGQQLLQSGVLGLERAQPLDVDRVHLSEVLAPGVDRGLAE